MFENLPEVVGHALRNQRAGLDKTAFSLVDLRAGTGAIAISSLAFADHSPMPALYTADGPGRSPPLQWSGVPATARSLVLIVEDADSPTPQPLVHAIVVGLSADEGALAEGALPSPDHEGSGHQVGLNSLLQAAWLPPDPPPGHGVHRYVFQLFALAGDAGLASSPGREAVLNALREHAVASGCLVGTYERPDASVRSGDEAVESEPASTGLAM